jgi:MFS family permease
VTENRPSKHYHRNFICLACDFGFFGVGLAFINTSTVIPSFLTTLGASSALIGLVSSLQAAGWLLPQLFAARYLAGKTRKKPYILWPAAIGRSLFLALALALWLSRGRPAWLIIALATLVITLFWVGDGLASVPWFDLLSKAIPPNRRGRMTGTGQFLTAMLSFPASAVVEWMLSGRGPGFPNNYVYLFLLGAAGLGASFLAVSLIHEEKDGTTASRPPSWREYIPQLWKVLKSDQHFRRLIIARQIFGLNALATPFYMTYALERLRLPAHVAGRYIAIGVVGSLLAAGILGWVNERYGSKRVIQISITLAVAVPTIALAMPRLIADPTWLAWGYGLVFLCYNAMASSLLPGWMNYVLELAPEAQRSTYVGLTNTINGLSTVFGIVGGLILQWTGGNYDVLFLLTIACMLLAWPLPRKLPEPRHRS